MCKDSGCTAQERHSFSVTMLYEEIIAVCSTKNIELTNAPCGQNIELYNVIVGRFHPFIDHEGS